VRRHHKSGGLSWLSTAVTLVTLLTGCVSLTRLPAVPQAQTELAEVPGIPRARAWLDRDLHPFIERVIRDSQREADDLRASGKATDPMPPAYVLAISGGGDAGAFAAGILSGWSARGDRPQFKVVTGISAGALIAPFAFLGPEYDGVVRTVATTAGPNSIVRKRSTLIGLASDGMYSSEPLSTLITKYVTPEVLAAIAHEYARGRALEIGTTDLDAARQVTWNMGEIALSKSPGALDLFRKIMLASASIPGVISPVLIDVEANGRRYQEMHVDGAVISQVFLYPASFLTELQRATGQPLKREIHSYVIRNGTLDPDWNSTRRRTLSIGARAIRTVVQTQGISDVHRLYEIAKQDRADFNLAYIGPEFDVQHAKDFDTAYMKELFAYGYGLAITGDQWHKAPPGE
jgi:predicted acylesterase/phospholipase RssA